MPLHLCNPFRVESFMMSSTQGGASRLRRFAYPGLLCLTPSGSIGSPPRCEVGSRFGAGDCDAEPDRTWPTNSYRQSTTHV